MTRRQASALLLGAAVGAACGSNPATSEEYPDSIRRELDRQLRTERDVANSAMPPRHLDEERFPETLVDRFGIVSGGPEPDGIPPIDEPRFTPAGEVDWLENQEAVLLLTHGDAARIYPVQIMLWHEIVNDVVEELPISVTYCPLCNSAVAFDRRIEGDVLDFGTSGALFNSALVMYDRQTESLWTHFDGLSVVGTLMGSQLELVPVQTVSWEVARTAHPRALVLNRDTGNPRPYGENAYPGYGLAERPLPGFFNGDVSEVLPPMSRIIGIRPPAIAHAIAVPLDVLEDHRVIELEDDVVMLWATGAASALDAETVAGGADIGQTGAFLRVATDGAPATLRTSGSTPGVFVDEESQSEWTVLGEAIAGPRVGATLPPVEHLDTFWFAWSSYEADSRVVDRSVSTR